MQARPDRILDYREYPVLYVDDEPECRRLFELGFRREFSVQTARSGEEALAKIHGSPIALVLSEHHLAGMTGSELLARAYEVDPRTVRMLVTACDDIGTLGQAINAGAISRLVSKPWAPDLLRDALRDGIESYALDREREQLLRELTLLHRMAKSMAQELALSPLLDLILSTAVVELGFDAAAMLLLDASGDGLRWERFAPQEDAVSNALGGIELSMRTAPAFLRRLCNAEAQLLPLDHAPQLEGAIQRWVTEVAAEEILIVPLHGRVRALGALAVDNRRGGRRFTTDDQTLLEGLAGQAGIAIENARLVEDLQRTRDPGAPSQGHERFAALAAALAHELNNPLVSIQTFLQLAPERRSEPDAEFWSDHHALACQELARIRGLVAALEGIGGGAGAPASRELRGLLEAAKGIGAEATAEASPGDPTFNPPAPDC